MGGKKGINKMTYIKEIENSNTLLVVLEDFEPELQVEIEPGENESEISILDVYMYGYRLGMDHQAEILTRFDDKIQEGIYKAIDEMIMRNEI